MSANDSLPEPEAPSPATPDESDIPGHDARQPEVRNKRGRGFRLEANRRITDARLARAERLDLSNLQLKTVPESLAKLTWLQELVLSHNNLTTLPAWLGDFSALRTLSLAYNGLATLPDSFRRLARMTRLNLRNNGLEALPEPLQDLIALRTLDLTDNLLTLPEWLRRLNLLEWLSLSGVGLAALPDPLRSLPRLEVLNLDRNALTELPEWLGGLKCLVELNLRNNRLVALPKSLGQLVSLRRLDVAQNRLTGLPPSLGRLRKLEQLYLHDNDGLGIPPEILGAPRPANLSWGADATIPSDILRYYFRIRAEPTQPLNEAKILIVGQGDVGKTSLVKRIVLDGFDQFERKTEGINITHWVIPGKDRPGAGGPIRLNIWDFGGQEIMHATHQFFLTKRSLYLLVLDARKGEVESNLHYWLAVIQSYGGDAPVIVVTNKCEPPHHLDLNESRLRKDYAPNLKAFLKVSCKEGTGIPALRDAIAAHIGDLPHVGDHLPDSYFQVKRALERKRSNFIDYSDYVRICNKHGVRAGRDQETLIRFLHDLGNVLYFHDPGSPYGELRDTSILNPEWVTGGVYKIINSLDLARRGGVLELARLGQVLGNPKTYPADRHDFLVGMMRKFELCFDFPDTNGQRLLVPELLHPNEPELGFDLTDALNFEYHYKVLPSGLISRFIVRMHYRLTKNPTYWRSGVVLDFDGNTALVRADTQSGRIYISVFGHKAGRPRALDAIREAFRYIHGTIPKISAEEKVPLSRDPGVVVGYTHLLRLEKESIDFFLPDGAEHQYQVKGLLDRIHRRVFEVFLSHNTADKPVVRQLAQMLEGRGVKVWFDEWELIPGRPWQEQLETIIQEVAVSAVLIGEGGFGPWELPEMRACVEEFVRRGMPVIPVLLPGAPDQVSLPPFLRRYTWVDLRGGLREEGLDRLQWGITGKKPH